MHDQYETTKASYSYERFIEQTPPMKDGLPRKGKKIMKIVETHDAKVRRLELTPVNRRLDSKAKENYP